MRQLIIKINIWNIKRKHNAWIKHMSKCRKEYLIK